MREYGIVSPFFWIGKTGRALRKHPYAQRVAMYLMTAPSAEMTGVFYCPLLTILNDVGSPFEGALKGDLTPVEGGANPLEGVAQAISTLMKLNFCFYDFESEFVFVTEMARWQVAEKLKPKDNRVSNIKKLVSKMPKSIAARFVERYNEDFCLDLFLESYGETLTENESPSEAPLKALGSQEQEQDQEQNIYISDTSVSLVKSSEVACDDSETQKIETTREACPYEKIADVYNEVLGDRLGHCMKLTPMRKTNVRARWLEAKKEGWFEDDPTGVEFFRRYFIHVSGSNFLMGNKKPRLGESTAWRASFDFLFKSENFTKIREGQYHR